MYGKLLRNRQPLSRVVDGSSSWLLSYIISIHSHTTPSLPYYHTIPPIYSHVHPEHFDCSFIPTILSSSLAPKLAQEIINASLLPDMALSTSTTAKPTQTIAGDDVRTIIGEGWGGEGHARTVERPAWSEEHDFKYQPATIYCWNAPYSHPLLTLTPTIQRLKRGATVPWHWWLLGGVCCASNLLRVWVHQPRV